MLAGDKSLTKKVLRFHGILTPQFATVFRGALDWAETSRFPLIVKPPQEDASLGITPKSVVHDVKELFERDRTRCSASISRRCWSRSSSTAASSTSACSGNATREALPVIELDFSEFPADRPKIASWEAKWGDGRREREGRGVRGNAVDLSRRTSRRSCAERMQKVGDRGVPRAAAARLRAHRSARDAGRARST